MKNVLRIIFLLIVSFDDSFGYDGILSAYYKKFIPNSEEFLDYENKYNLTRIPEEAVRSRKLDEVPSNQKGVAIGDLDRSPIELVFKDKLGQLSFKKDESGQTWFGLYFVTELSNSFPPFSRVDGNLSSPASMFKDIQQPLFQESKFLGSLHLKLLNQAHLSVVELYDAAITLEYLDYLSEIKTLEILGLPCRGVKFDRDFNFPASLKTLVVRNAELNEFFFEALNKLKGLKRLVILNCTTTIEYPIVLELSYFRELSWRERPRIFKGVK
jgi:hypothetical protein